jgi:hypothetical protein
MGMPGSADPDGHSVAAHEVRENTLCAQAPFSHFLPERGTQVVTRRNEVFISANR